LSRSCGGFRGKKAKRTKAGEKKGRSAESVWGKGFGGELSVGFDEEEEGGKACCVRSFPYERKIEKLGRRGKKARKTPWKNSQGV